jgi:hypothetical protein
VEPEWKGVDPMDDILIENAQIAVVSDGCIN